MVESPRPNNTKVAEPRKRRPRFWVAPLLVGCSFSLGYGVTHRLVTMRTNPEPQPQPERFAGLDFPGESLVSLRQANGTKSSLAVDVAAIEAKEALERQAKAKAEEQARPQEELAPTNELASQTPLPEPSWTAPELTESDQHWPQVPWPNPAALIEPLVDPSLDLFNTRDPLLESTAPEATVDQRDFLVPLQPIPAPYP